MVTVRRKLESIFLLLLDFVLWILLTPLILLVFLPLWIYKSFVGLLLFLFRKDLAFITTVDSLVVRCGVQQDTVCDVGTIIKIEGSLSLQELKNRFIDAVKPNKDVSPDSPLYRLHCRFTTFFGYLCTQAVEIQVDQQIWEETCPKGSLPQAFFSTWFHRPYRNNKLPRWEMILLRTPTEEAVYLGFRANHGLMDGAGLNLLQDLLFGSKTPMPGTLPKGSGSTFLGRFKLWFILPREVIKFFLKTGPVDRSKAEDLRAQIFHLSWSAMELKRILAIRRKLGVGFGPLLYSIQSEALFLYMKEKGKIEALKDKLPVLHTIPRDVPHPGGMRNHFSIVRLDLPFAEADLTSAERADRVNEIYKTFLEREWHTLGIEYVTSLANLFPVIVHPFNFKTRMSLYRLHLANVMLSSEPYYMLGKKVENIFRITTLPSVCPEAVLLSDCMSRGDTMDIAHIGSSRIFKTREDLEYFTNECFPKVVAALEG